MHRSPRRQAASSKDAGSVVLMVPAVPGSSVLLPRYQPPCSNMASMPTTPDDTISFDTVCSNLREVTNSTEMPLSVMRWGYSLVPWVLPRYFTMRSRRVVI